MSSYSIVHFLNNVSDLILNPLIILAFSFAFLYFFYGIVKYLGLDAADAARIEARNAILWGLLGMLIMFSVYGIIHFILRSFGIEAGDIDSPGALDFLKLR